MDYSNNNRYSFEHAATSGKDEQLKTFDAPSNQAAKPAEDTYRLSIDPVTSGAPKGTSHTPSYHASAEISSSI